MKSAFERLEPFMGGSDRLTVVIETPQGSRNKYKYDEDRGLFTLSAVLPAGASFPFDFGFIPGTRGDDGDPLDVLLLMDTPAFAGCVVPSRLFGVIEAEQESDKGKERNDRLLAVAADSRDHRDVRDIKDVNTHLIEEIEHFFISYNQMRGRRFTPKGRSGGAKALELVKKAADTGQKK